METTIQNNYWQEVDNLRTQLLKETQSLRSKDPCLLSVADDGLPACQVSDAGHDREKVIALIECAVQECVESIGSGKSPILSHLNRNTWANISFDKVKGVQLSDDSSKTHIKFDSILSVNKFALTIQVLSLMHEHLQRDTYCTKRDLYYRAPQLFGSQSVVDNIVDNISCMLSVPRWHLHVLATSKGCLAGNLQYLEIDGNYVDCSQTATGYVIPSHVTGLSNMQTKAKFVLVVEKDATFQTLMENDICSKLQPCIIITGKGFPDMNTRLMVRKLWDTFHLPTLVLVDADPHGIEIMSVYKYGSRSLSFEASNLTVPSIRWLGLLPSDIDRLQVPQTSLLCLSAADKDKANELLHRSYIAQHAAWKTQIERILSSGVKAELQCLAAISPSFLTDVYLPNKIRFGGWI